MTARHLSHVAVLGAAVVVVVSFVLSAGAVIDYAIEIGVDRRLAMALPVCVEALMVVAGAVMVARRIDDKAAPSRLAQVMFYAAVAVTFAVNWAHGGGGVPSMLSAVPALSLPASLHLALEEWLRVRDARPRKRVPRTPNARRRSTTGTSPAETQVAVTSTNGTGPRKLTLDELRVRYDQAALAELVAAHGSWSAVAAMIPTNRSSLYALKNELESAA